MQQSSSIDFKLVQRVCLLQQALDQALGSLDELKAQVKDKQWVETQLANTEQYANVQQQAIAHLKQQLSQFAEVQTHLLSVMGYRLNELIDSQQTEFGRVNLQFQRSHVEVQTYLQYVGQHHFAANALEADEDQQRLALEAEVMTARSMVVNLTKHLGIAQQHLEGLTTKLNSHHLNISQIVKTIQSMIADLEAFDGISDCTASISSDPVTPAASTPEFEPIPERVSEIFEDGELDVPTLKAALRREQGQRQELEAFLLEQFEHQTHIRQRYQEVAAERDYYKRELEKARHLPRQPSLPAARESVAELEPGRESRLPTGRRRQRSQHPPIQPLKLPEQAD